jgi:hypothetical protein
VGYNARRQLPDMGVGFAASLSSVLQLELVFLMQPD